MVWIGVHNRENQVIQTAEFRDCNCGSHQLESLEHILLVSEIWFDLRRILVLPLNSYRNLLSQKKMSSLFLYVRIGEPP